MGAIKVRWLYSELPKLVAAGVLSEESAARIRGHYGPVPNHSVARIAAVLLAVLGCALMGAGVILILAHNWEQLGRPLRAGLAFVPLLIGQACCFFALLRRPESVAWREGAGTFCALAIGACIALISQTYHLPGDLGAFLLVWVLLGAPLIYLLRSSAVAVLYLAGVLAWFGASHGEAHARLVWCLLTAIAFPHLVWAWRRHAHAPRFALLSIVSSVHLACSLIFLLSGRAPGIWIVVYAALASGMAMGGMLWAARGALGPVRMAGMAGVVLWSLLLTFESFWREFGLFPAPGSRPELPFWAVMPDYLVAFALLSVVVLIAGLALRSKVHDCLPWGGAALLGTIMYFAVARGMPPSVATVAFNLYLLALGAYAMLVGTRMGRLGLLNGGMAILILLMTVRFFDSNLGFTVRGIAFLLAGAAFLGVNHYVKRRSRALPEVEG